MLIVRRTKAQDVRGRTDGDYHAIDRHTQEGQAMTIKTKPASDEYRARWERAFRDEVRDDALASCSVAQAKPVMDSWGNFALLSDM